MNQQTQAPAPSQAIALAEPSASIIRAASELPERDLVAVTAQISRVACSNASLAQSCLYCRPVGKKDGKQQFAMGPSVRLTELGQQQFGRIWLSSGHTQDNRRVTAKVLAFDLSTLNITTGECSKNIARRDGSRYSDTQIEVVTGAALAIARRNALLQQMRAQLEAVLVDVKVTLIKNLTKDGKGKYSEALKALGEEFARFGVDYKQVEAVVAHAKTNEDGLVMLIGILNAIEDGLVSAGEVFNVSSKPPVAPTRRRAPKKAEKPAEPAPPAEPAESADEPSAPASGGEDGDTEPPPEEEAQTDTPITTDMLRELGKQAGFDTDETLNAALLAVFGLNSVEDIAEGNLSEVHDFLLGKAEANAGT